jgi:hypothetical protein
MLYAVDIQYTIEGASVHCHVIRYTRAEKTWLRPSNYKPYVMLRVTGGTLNTGK